MKIRTTLLMLVGTLLALAPVAALAEGSNQGSSNYEKKMQGPYVLMDKADAYEDLAQKQMGAAEDHEASAAMYKALAEEYPEQAEEKLAMARKFQRLADKYRAQAGELQDKADRLRKRVWFILKRMYYAFDEADRDRLVKRIAQMVKRHHLGSQKIEYLHEKAAYYHDLAMQEQPPSEELLAKAAAYASKAERLASGLDSFYTRIETLNKLLASLPPEADGSENK